jgi:hypothetical protein
MQPGCKVFSRLEMHLLLAVPVAGIAGSAAG